MLKYIQKHILSKILTKIAKKMQGISAVSGILQRFPQTVLSSLLKKKSTNWAHIKNMVIQRVRSEFMFGFFPHLVQTGMAVAATPVSSELTILSDLSFVVGGVGDMLISAHIINPEIRVQVVSRQRCVHTTDRFASLTNSSVNHHGV